jgi:hypothetical protein
MTERKGIKIMGAIGTFTYDRIIGRIKTRLKLFNQEKYPKTAIFDDIYLALAESAELSGSKNDPIYRASAVIPQTKSVVSNDSAGVTWVNATKTLDVPLASTNLDNAWTGDADGFDPTWVGAAVTMNYIGIGLFQTTIAIVPSPPDVTHVVLADDLPDDFVLAGAVNPDATSIVMSSTAGANIVDISGIADYKFIDRITAIEDSISGLCVEMPEKDFRAIKNFVSDENDYRNDIIWYRSGGLIYFCKNSITSYGTRTMFYTRYPIKPTVYTEYIDFPDPMLNVLIDVVVTKILQALNVQLPQDLQSVQSKLVALRSAANEERQKAEANAKTQ